MNKRALVILAVFLLVLSGCQGIKYGRTKEQAAALADDTHVGTRGATIEFVRNTPPDMAFTGTPLNVILELKNEGAAEASGTVYLSGFDPILFNIQPRYKTFSRLEGKTKFNTFGGYETVEFSSSNIYLPQGTDTLEQNFLASICYSYRTEARIPVCIDPNPISMLENEACRVIDPIVGGGQGAPVAVTAIREEAAPGQANFLITIANVGDGTVIDLNSMANCPSNLGFNDVDSVRYSVELSGRPGTCKPVGKARLANKQGTIYCTFTLADSTSAAYQSVLEVTLDYAYLSQKSKKVRIRNLGT